MNKYKRTIKTDEKTEIITYQENGWTKHYIIYNDGTTEEYYTKEIWNDDIKNILRPKQKQRRFNCGTRPIPLPKTIYINRKRRARNTQSNQNERKNNT